MNLRPCVPGLMLSLILGTGCGRDEPRAVAPAKAVPSGPKTFSLKGVVRKVDAATGEVTIAHEEIAGFMGKMTMPFTLKDKNRLEGIEPGDEVEGPLRVDYEAGQVKDMELEDLTVTRASTALPQPSVAPPEPMKPGETVPDFAMTTQAGKSLRLADWRGEIVVLTFIYTRCPSPEFCPAMDAKFAELARRISAVPGRSDHVRLLSVSFDPEHDTPEVLSAHAARRGAKPPLWTFAVASHDELARVVGSFGLAYAPGTREIDHNLRAAVIDTEGRLVRLEAGAGWTPADLFQTIQALRSSVRP